MLGLSLRTAKRIVYAFQDSKRSEDLKLEKNFKFRKGYHTPRSARQHLWINGEYTRLPDNDPGGEHE